MEKYTLRIYIAGLSPKAITTIDSLKKVCEEQIDGECELEIINVLETPELAEDEKILATPTIIKELPEPVRRIIGNLSDESSALIGLDLLIKN